MLFKFTDIIQHLPQHSRLISMLSVTLLCAVFFFRSLNYPLHDFSNSYFPAQIAQKGLQTEDIIFDIYEFNRYAWDQGYEEVLIDFYLNSPFTVTLFYPLSFIQDAYLAKSIFNILSVLVFLIGLNILLKKYLNNRLYLAVFLPVLFLKPIQNNLLFGQSYLLLFGLVIIAFECFKRKQLSSAGTLMSTVALLKVFPVLYGAPLVFSGKWKAVGYCVIISFFWLIISYFTAGDTLWVNYLAEVLPNAIANNSTIDFRPNSQSVDIFLRTLLVRDTFYNPSAPFHNPLLYKVFVWFIKSVIMGFTIQLSIKYKDDLFKLLALWIVALFLIQTRTATYAQILWIMPTLVFIQPSGKKWETGIFLVVLFVVCNFSFSWLNDTPIIFRFSRMWLSLGLAGLFWCKYGLRWQPGYILLGFMLFLPICLPGIIGGSVPDDGEYVFTERKHFMVHDFGVEHDTLTYKALGFGGETLEKTNIRVETIQTERCEIVDNQIFLDENQITFDPSIKRKASLINGHYVYYLTDRNSRRGAFTLKKIQVNLKN